MFSEGGNFTPKEIEVYHKRLEKMTKRIDATEENVVLDMDVTESKCLDQVEARAWGRAGAGDGAVLGGGWGWATGLGWVWGLCFWVRGLCFSEPGPEWGSVMESCHGNML